MDPVISPVDGDERCAEIAEGGFGGLSDVLFGHEDADRSVLVGATSAGPWGGEVLSALQVAVRAEVPLATLRNMPYAYPTFHRAIEDALAALS